MVTPVVVILNVGDVDLWLSFLSAVWVAPLDRITARLGLLLLGGRLGALLRSKLLDDLQVAADRQATILN